jgi:hypothetical protein
MPKDEMAVIEGTVSRVFQATQNDKGAWKPIKIAVSLGNGSMVDCIAFPKRDYESKEYYDPLVFDNWVKGLNLATLEGESVTVIGVLSNNSYSGNAEMKDINSFKLGGNAEAPKQTNTSQHQQRPHLGIDENQMRIMRQSTLHYASILIAPLVKDFEYPQLMVEKTIEVAGKLLEYVITGEMPFQLEQAETVAQEEPEEELFGVLEAG